MSWHPKAGNGIIGFTAADNMTFPNEMNEKPNGFSHIPVTVMASLKVPVTVTPIECIKRKKYVHYL